MCIIIDNKNIFLHNPKCAGTSIISLINNNNISNKIEFNKKYSKGHFGVYNLIKNNIFNNEYNFHIILRDPIEWYVSFYKYVKKFENHPFYPFTKSDFKYFFYNIIDLSNIKIDYESYLEKHIQSKKDKTLLFENYKPYNILKNDINNDIYSLNHPDFNILLSKKILSEGIYSYFLLFIISKINPLIVYKMNKDEIIDNIDNIITPNIKYYHMNNLQPFLNNVNINSIPKNLNSGNITDYKSYYDNEMLSLVYQKNKIIYHFMDKI